MQKERPKHKFYGKVDAQHQIIQFELSKIQPEEYDEEGKILTDV